jgi:hypothetical protein
LYVLGNVYSFLDNSLLKPSLGKAFKGPPIVETGVGIVELLGRLSTCIIGTVGLFPSDTEVNLSSI